MASRKYLHLLGSISSGKGFTCKALKQEFGDDITIIGLGDLVRARLDIDTHFKETYGAGIAKGNLLPDDVAAQLLNSALQQPLSSLVAVEGFDRTPDQVFWSKRKGLIASKETSVALRLNASEHTCYNRHIHRNKSKPDGHRSDTSRSSFHRKHSTFVQLMEAIDAEFRRCGCEVINIDANGDLEKDVFPAVLRTVNEFLGVNVRRITPAIQTPLSHTSSRTAPQLATASA